VILEQYGDCLGSGEEPVNSAQAATPQLLFQLPPQITRLLQEFDQMQTRQDNRLKYEIQFPDLPLMVYREIAAHLRQVEGGNRSVHQSEQFDYNQSQVGGLWIQYSQAAGAEESKQVDQILAYYQDRYGAD